MSYLTLRLGAMRLMRVFGNISNHNTLTIILPPFVSIFTVKFVLIHFFFVLVTLAVYFRPLPLYGANICQFFGTFLAGGGDTCHWLERICYRFRKVTVNYV